MSARPIASICCSPPDSVPPSWWVRSRSRGKRSMHPLDVGLDRRLVAGEGAHLEVLEDGHPREDPAALRGVADALRGRARGPRSCEMSLPSKVTLPRRGWSRPLIVLRVVVLPAPLAPMSVTISPSADGQRDALEGVDVAVVGVDVVEDEHRRLADVGAGAGGGVALARHAAGAPR